ncbi:MAG: J domain-containing protein [Bryobacterales bacterium]|nr:J domain-containing protein [Bryobacterales bacterium]
MTYYEEFGLSPHASAEEIREAYRQLARLLHPDRSQDERSRQLAETQMKRLNVMMEVLTSAEKRSQYDASLREAGPPKLRLVVAQGRVGNLQHFLLALARQAAGRLRDYRHPNNAWLLACTTVILALFWAFREGISRPDAVKPSPAIRAAAEIEDRAFAGRSTQPQASPRAIEYLEGQVVYWRRQSDQMRGQRDAATLQVSRLESTVTELSAWLNTARLDPFGRGAPSAQSCESMATVSASSESSHRPAMAEPARMPPNPSVPTRRSMAGNWYYVRPPGASGLRDDVYPPEYIETVIVEESGTLRGRYRARYRIPDRAISPEVAFQFSGRAGPDPARLPWTGPGGARGEVRLRLLSANSIEVAWIASELGSAQGLGSGSATLVRRQDP